MVVQVKQAVLVLLLSAAVSVQANSEEDRCLRSAARDFNVSFYVLKAIRMQEAGKIGRVNCHNKNSTCDVGPMQINTIHVPKLTSLGITLDDLTYDLCSNLYAGAWYYRKMRNLTKSRWKAVAFYHNRDDYLGAIYMKKVLVHYKTLTAQ